MALSWPWAIYIIYAHGNSIWIGQKVDSSPNPKLEGISTRSGNGLGLRWNKLFQTQTLEIFYITNLIKF